MGRRGDEAPLNGKFDGNWIGLGWIHPDAVKRRRQQLDDHFASTPSVQHRQRAA